MPSQSIFLNGRKLSISEVVFSVYKSHKQFFEQKGLPEGEDKEYCAVIYDFHTVGVVALHEGRPLEDFGGMEITVFDQPVSLKRSQIDKYKECLRNLVTRLCPQTCDCKPAPVLVNCVKQGSLPMRTYPTLVLQAPPLPQYQANSGMAMGVLPPPPSSWGPSPAPNLVPVVHTISFQPTYNNGMGGFY